MDWRSWKMSEFSWFRLILTTIVVQTGNHTLHHFISKATHTNFDPPPLSQSHCCANNNHTIRWGKLWELSAHLIRCSDWLIWFFPFKDNLDPKLTDIPGYWSTNNSRKVVWINVSIIKTKLKIVTKKTKSNKDTGKEEE